ncbi:MAG: bifunctional diaminohydroxyphosphoribosylaminopyrimidine deaminase/5-amino-6-(5-phosphoribosylamino)uracil reductase RibD [Solirubrobacterales bacterium]
MLRRAIELAGKGAGLVAPNPMVGAVVVRDGELIGEGFHAELGGAHAEVAALADCAARGADPAGATMVVTLEPCAHHGRQPPCTDAIIAAGIARVVIGCEDPTDKASGRGPGILRDEGVDVVFAEGAEASTARMLDQAFRKHSRTAKPLVIHKAAVSLDGATATASGHSRWISGPESREQVHRWRAEAGAIAIGIETAVADDPMLTARAVDAPRQPLRVVFDREARLPLGSQLVATAAQTPVLVLAGAQAPSARAEALRGAGVEVAGAATIAAALEELGSRGINSLLLEGGATLAGAFLAAGEIDELRLFLAPVLLGGAGRPLYGGDAPERIEDAIRPLDMTSEPSGADLLVRARLREW